MSRSTAPFVSALSGGCVGEAYASSAALYFQAPPSCVPPPPDHGTHRRRADLGADSDDNAALGRESGSLNSHPMITFSGRKTKNVRLVSGNTKTLEEGCLLSYIGVDYDGIAALGYDSGALNIYP